MTIQVKMYKRVKALAFAALLTNIVSGETANSEFDWDAVESSWDLRYSPCYNGFQCARLLMPLDWLNTASINETVALAIIKLPATVDHNDESFGGTLITNPGGPGGSGIAHVVRNGHYMQSMVDGEKHFDVLSFDPRGVARSMPIADCYSNELARTASAWQGQGFTNFDASAENIKYQKAFAAARGLQCAKPGPQGYAIQDYMSTASVAHDMVRIIDEIDKLHQHAIGQSGSGPQKPLATKHADVARLQYYGTSYGTILGNTFISMFPGRVKRMILDGVVVAEDWMTADWYGMLIDSEKALEYFYRSCFEAGSKCPLTKSSDQSWRSMQTRVNALLDDFEAKPIPFLLENGSESIITAAMVRSSMWDPLYQPIDKFDGLAFLLAEALEGNYTRLIQQSGLGALKGGCKEKVSGDYSWLGLASSAVVCGDAEDITKYDEYYWQNYFQKSKDRSPAFGRHVANIAFTCSGWKSRPKYRFTGPFTSPKADPDSKDGRPSAPALFLSAQIDPITPLKNAHTASKGHPESIVLTQKSVGHCVLYSAPSECTNKVLRAYMANGVLPKEGTECEPDCLPWRRCNNERAKLPR